VGIGEYNASAIEVYPNPTSDIVTISSEIKFNKVEVLNALGQKVVAYKIPETSNFSLTLPEECGIYLVHIFTQDSLTVRKIVKH
jgi:hypothetical protein